MIMEPEINRAWPDSIPLMPARMLMAFVQNTASIPMQTQYRMPAEEMTKHHLKEDFKAVNPDKEQRTTTQLTQIQVQSEQCSEGLGHHYDSVAKVGKIDHEQWQGSHGGKQELVSPPEVEHIIGKTKEDHATDGQKCTDELYKLAKTTHTKVRREVQTGKKHGVIAQQCTHLIMWEAHALISNKAAEERHWDETEKDDEEDSPTDDSLRLWTVKKGE